MPKRKTLSQEAMERNKDAKNEAKTQKAEVQAKRAKSAQKRARKEDIMDILEENEEV